jgi:uncharacterized protein YndB with AHSA1/START domain
MGDVEMFGLKTDWTPPSPGAPDALEARTWKSDVAIRTSPEHVLDTLTDVDACEAWSPVGFRVDGVDSGRLRTGTTATVTGSLAGRPVEFLVEVRRVDPERLVLRAAGPVEMFADYVVHPAGEGSRVDAEISVRRGRGLSGTLAAHATFVLLAAGALNHALARLAREAERRHLVVSP